MKKILLLFVFTSVITSCKQDSKTEDQTAVETISVDDDTDDVRMYRGEFIYLDDAAVLNCGNKIYGVEMDEKMQELANLVAPKKKEAYDMIPVIIKGTVRAKDSLVEGWEEIVTITEIVKILEPSNEAPIKIESGNTSGK